MRTRWTAALSGLVSITDRLNCEGLPLNKYQGLREELDDVEDEGNSVPVVIRAVHAVTPKLGG